MTSGPSPALQFNCLERTLYRVPGLGLLFNALSLASASAVALGFGLTAPHLEGLSPTALVPLFSGMICFEASRTVAERIKAYREQQQEDTLERRLMFVSYVEVFAGAGALAVSTNDSLSAVKVFMGVSGALCLGHGIQTLCMLWKTSHGSPEIRSQTSPAPAPDGS